MSNLTSTQEISSNPSKNAVTSAVDPTAKQADIDRKMKVYGIIDALRQGKYPDNQQIDEFFEFALHNSPVDQTKLSGEGRELIADVQSLLETLRQVVHKKNADELMQTALFAARSVDTDKVDPSKSVSTPVSGQQVKEDANEAAENFKVLGKLILTNGEARKIAKDIGVLARDVAADAAAKAAETARPEEHKLNQVDAPAPDNQFHSWDETKKPFEQAADKAKEAKATAQDPNVQQQAIDQAQAAKNEAQAVDQSSASNTEVAKDKAAAKLDQLKDRIPEERKQQARELKDDAINYAKEKFPEERRERFIYRLKKVVVEMQRHPDYQDAIEYFLTLAETYKAHGSNVADQTQGHANDNLTSDPSFQAAYANFRTLLERFANNSSMEPIFVATRRIYEDVSEDPELSKWFKEFDTYLRRVLQEPGYVMTDAADEEARRLKNNGSGFFGEKYRPHREAWINAVESFFKAYANDPLNIQLGEDVKRLTKDLALNSEGSLQFKPHLWQDIRAVILPELLQKIGYLPIPRLEIISPEVDLVLENLTIQAQNLLPNIVEMEIKNYFKLSPYSGITNDSKHSFWIDFQQMQLDIKDLAFYVKKKKGFPKISESGAADLLVSGDGVCGKIHLESTGRRDDVFKVKNVDIRIANLKFKVHDATKHQKLINFFSPLATMVVKKVLPKLIENAIRDALEQLNSQLVDINERLDEADQREGVSKTDVVKEMFKRKEAEAQDAADKAEKAKRNSTFKVVTTRDGKVLPWSSPKSMVEKQGALADQIPSDQQSGWRTPIFSISKAQSAVSSPQVASPKSPAVQQA